MIGGKPIYRRARRGFAWFFGALFTAAAFGCATPPQTWPLPVGVGGVLGDLVLNIPAAFTGGFPKGALSLVLALPLLAAGLWLLAFAAALVSRKAPAPVKVIRSAAGEVLDDDEEEGGGFQAFAGAVTHYWLSMRASVARLTASRRAAQRSL